MKELIVEHVPGSDGQSARVRVGYRANERAQAQWREADFAFEFAAADRDLIRWYLEEYLQCPWGAFKDRAQNAEAALERIGAELFGAVFDSPETSRQYGHVADELAQTRIVIHAAGPEGVALPWELLRDPQKPYGDLARQAAAFVRSQPNLAYEPPAPPSGPTFNILLVISRPDKSDGTPDDVPFQSVARPLLELCRPYRDRIHIDVLRPPTFEQLQKVLGDRPGFYHVLHFDGHGAFPRSGMMQGMLFFEGENRPSRLVTGAELGGLLAGKGVPLVVLNACQSGMTQTEAIYASVGNQLLQAGVGGVVAMAYSVYVQSAVRFVARFYERLMEGDDAARAVQSGREALRAHPGRISPIGELPLRDWMVPIFFEAAAQPLVAVPLTGVRLLPAQQHDQQAHAGAEIGCPEPPAFGFVGRDDALLGLERAFLKETVVLLEGMAGVGKTETAAGFARWRAETGALDGPVFFFSFEHYAPLARVCDGVGTVFQPVVKQQLGVEWALLDADQRRDLAAQLLRQVPCLLIWDNFEPVHGFPAGAPSDWTADEQDELCRFLVALRGGATKVLLTSRRAEPWLGPLYRHEHLGGLNLIEAQELAVRVLERAGLNLAQIQALPDYNALLGFLRGNPLAIQTILPELAHLPPAELLAALQSGEAKLPRDDTQDRERSLWASLNYRFDRLDPVVRQRLGVLGLFQGFVETPVLAAMGLQDGAPELLCGLQPENWQAALDVAVEMGLLSALGDGRYTMHPALPWFFHDLLDEVFPSQRPWLDRAFCVVCGALGRVAAEQFASAAEAVMGMLRVEEGNLQHALRLARRHAQWDEIEFILAGLTHLLETQGRWVEWERLVTSLEAATLDEAGQTTPGCEALQLALWRYQQQISSYRRDFDMQEKLLFRLKAHYEQAGDDRNQAFVLHQLGRAADGRRQWDEAERWYRQSLDIHRRIGDTHREAIILHNLGRIAQEQRQWDEAEQRYHQSLDIHRRLGDAHRQASTLHHLGRIAQERRQWDEAEQWYRQSLEIERHLGDAHGEATTLHQLGVLAQERRRWDEAEQWYRQSLDIKRRIGDAHGEASTLHNLGVLAQERGQGDEAEQWYRQSLDIHRRRNDSYHLAMAQRSWARVQQRREEA